MKCERKSSIPISKRRHSSMKEPRIIDYCSYLIPKGAFLKDHYRDVHFSIEAEEQKWKIQKEMLLKGNYYPYTNSHMACPLLNVTAKEVIPLKESLKPVTCPAKTEGTVAARRVIQAARSCANRVPTPIPTMSTNDIRQGLYRNENASFTLPQGVGSVCTLRKAFLRAECKNDMILPWIQKYLIGVEDQIRKLRPSSAMNYGNCLTKSATTSRITNSPKAFGEKTHVNREDHERERTRWLSKLDEIEARLGESETLNSEMQLIRAELNKKIVDLEKNQRPLIDQNRKLGERNKLLSGEVKKVEQKLCHSQDDFLTLKDTHERLLKELSALKEKRAYPEKLEELDRYRNQVLEYSKCITALRSSGLEKDRRYELLVQKFKRLRKCMKKSDTEDDRQSTIGSDCSAESSISLDTITEDFEESLNKDIEINYQALYRENAELQRALQALKLSPTGLSDEGLLKDQLSFAHTTIAQQQILIDSNQEMISQSAAMKATMMEQANKIVELERVVEELSRELGASKDNQELLEFQMLELEENSKCEDINACHDMSIDTQDLFGIEEELDVEAIEISELKQRLAELENSALLKKSQRQIVGKAANCIENLETELTTKSVEEEKLIGEFQAKLKEAQTQLEDSYSKQKKKKELQIEVEEKRKKVTELEGGNATLNNEICTLSKELSKLRENLQMKELALEAEKTSAAAIKSELEKRLQASEEQLQAQKAITETLEKDLVEAMKKIDSMHANTEEMEKKQVELMREIQRLENEKRPPIKTDLERRFEETKYKLSEAMEKIHSYEVIIETAKKSGEDKNLTESLQEDLIQLKEYNNHLEIQFQTQSNIIDTLKTKIIQQKSFAEFVRKLAEGEEIDSMERDLLSFAKTQEKEEGRLAENFAAMLRAARKDNIISSITPLEIATAHHKIRPYNSVDSSGEWLSNSSEGIVSPDDGESEEWDTAKGQSARAVQCGDDYMVRSSSSQSS